MDPAGDHTSDLAADQTIKKIAYGTTKFGGSQESTSREKGLLAAQDSNSETRVPLRGGKDAVQEATTQRPSSQERII